MYLHLLDAGMIAKILHIGADLIPNMLEPDLQCHCEGITANVD